MTPFVPVADALDLLADAGGTQTSRAIVDTLNLSLRDLAERVAGRCAPLARQDPQSALLLARRTVVACDVELDVWAHARALRILASCLIAAQPAEALAVLERSEALFREAGDEAAALHSRIGQIGALNELGRQDDALALTVTTRRGLRVLGLTTPLGKLYANEAAILLYLGRVREAARRLAWARTLLRRSGEGLDLARIDGRRAVILEELGEARTARHLYRRTLAIYRARGMLDAQARTMADLGILAIRMGNLAEALRLLLDARAIFRDHGDDYATAVTQIGLAEAYVRLNMWPEAQACLDAALQLLTERSPALDRARAFMLLASLRHAQGGTAEAVSWLAQAEAEYTRAGAALEGLVCVLMQAGLAHGTAEQAAHLARLAELEDAFAAIGAPARRLSARLLRARLARGLADRVAARTHLEEAERQARSLCLLPLLYETLQARGSLERDEDPDLAWTMLQEALSLVDRTRRDLLSEDLRIAFVTDKHTLYQDLVALCLRNPSAASQQQAFALVEQAKSRTLLDLLQGDPAVQRQAIADPLVRRRLETLREEIAWLQLQLGRSGTDRGLLALDTLQTRLQESEQRYGQLLHEAQAKRAPRAARLGDVVSTAAIHAALERDTALVEFYEVDGRYLLFVLDQAGLRVLPLETGPDDVQPHLDRLWFQLEKFRYGPRYVERAMDHLHATARVYLEQLFTAVAAPWYDQVGARRLVISPHGILHGVPFHALYDGISHVLEDRVISYAPNAGLWHHCLSLHGTAPSRRGSLVVGVPHDGLEHIEEEVAAVASVLPRARTLVGAAATRGCVLRHMARSTCIHLASHSVFRRDNPLFSGIWLADGWLTAHDLTTLRLHAGLVTLSACETGVQRLLPGDELFGLVRGFLQAGCSSVVASLWPVHDAATAELMRRFYAARATGRENDRALRDAQLAGLRAGQHPYYWAPFMLAGSYR